MAASFQHRETPTPADAPTIRRARLEDARAIHDVHMRSIRENCAPDYTATQIDAWGGRPYDESARKQAIELGHVWVVEAVGRVTGFGYLEIGSTYELTHAEVKALYFAPEAKGSGLGRQLLALMEQEAKRAGATTLVLESTLTSEKFYQKCGFVPAGEKRACVVQGVDIPCVPYEKVLQP